MIGNIFKAITNPIGSIIGAGIGAASSLIGGKQQNAANAQQAAQNQNFQAGQTAEQMRFQADQTAQQMRFQADQTQKQHDYNSAEARRQMDFQQAMRATQYQTTIADLKAAGLNPMLAYAQGGAGNLTGAAGQGSAAAGAAASGAAAAGAQAQMGNPLGASANSAKEMALAVQQYANMVNQNTLLEEQAEKTQADRFLSLDQAAYTRAQTARELEQMPGYSKFGKLRDAQIQQLQSSSAQQASQTRYTNELTGLAKTGSAPSSSKPIYQDIKGMLHSQYDKYQRYLPFGKMK
jgi:hypothetical protein